MKILAATPESDIARVFVCEFDNGKRAEMVCSVQPPYKREEKWVLIISTLYGCSIGCSFCDAGGEYNGNISFKNMISQIDFLINLYYKNGKIPVKKFKIQFARMGEPALNNDVLTVLKEIRKMYDAPGLIPSISSVAPKNREDFFYNLKEIK